MSRLHRTFWRIYETEVHHLYPGTFQAPGNNPDVAFEPTLQSLKLLPISFLADSDEANS
jgi:hypothetical protein